MYVASGNVMRLVTDTPIPEEPPFSILEISADAPEQREEAGTKTRFWFTHRDGDIERRRVFSRRRRPDSGNDWAGRIVCELARLAVVRPIIAALLLRLLSGAIRVRMAQRVVEAAP